MATVPAHIKTARSRGAQAGMEQLVEYLDRNTNGGTNGLDTNRTMLSAIRKAGKFNKRNGEFKAISKAVAWYCNHFAEKFGTDELPEVIEGVTVRRVNRPTTTTTITTESTENTDANPDVAAIVAAAVQAAMAAIQVDQPVEVESDASDSEDVENDEDEAPVAAPKYVPRNPDEPATNGKLWTLNTEGPDFGYFLCIIDSEGNVVAGGDEPLTNGEAHELIAEIRA